MAKTLLTFLGNNRYLPCHYTWQGSDTQKPESRFVQVAIAQHFCKDWGPEDRIVIFLTRDSERNNWNDGGFQTPGRTGLETELNAVAHSIEQERGSCFQILPVPNIPEGFTIDDGWKLIQILLEQTREGDEIILDITHGFRTLPMLCLSYLSYAKMVKQVQVAHILYGAFEEKGEITEDERAGRSIRPAPIYDYILLLQLNQWISATSDFIHRGDGNPLHDLAKQAKAQIYKLTEPDEQDLKNLESLNKVGGLLAQFSNNIRSARGNELFAEDAQNRQKVIEAAKSVQDRLPLLGGLIDRLQFEMAEYEHDSWKNGLLAARWCASRNLAPQAYTLLQETLFTAIVQKIKGDLKNKEHRDAASYALQCAMNPNSGEYTGDAREQFQAALEIVQKLPQEVLKGLDLLCKRRNDINHAGFIKHKASAETLQRDVNNVLAIFTPETTAEIDKILGSDR